jgi:hypothetical protein
MDLSQLEQAVRNAMMGSQGTQLSAIAGGYSSGDSEVRQALHSLERVERETGKMTRQKLATPWV